jgi:predicted RNA-binding Zn ribbon-like protein
MRTYDYELVGGHPVLDFLNTVQAWKAASLVDRLQDFGDVLGFAVAAGVLGRSEAKKLAGRTAPAVVRQLRELRSALARVIDAIISSGAPTPADLDLVAREASRAAGVSRLQCAGGKVMRTIEVDDAGLNVVGWRLADAAVALLTADAMSVVKSCPRCGWFFLDTSKNHSRRWCSMQMCGSAVKSQRYYYSQKPRGDGRSRADHGAG